MALDIGAQVFAYLLDAHRCEQLSSVQVLHTSYPGELLWVVAIHPHFNEVLFLLQLPLGAQLPVFGLPFDHFEQSNNPIAEFLEVLVHCIWARGLWLTIVLVHRLRHCRAPRGGGGLKYRKALSGDLAKL